MLVELEKEGLTITRITPPYEDPVVPENVSKARDWPDTFRVSIYDEQVDVPNKIMSWDAFAAHFSLHAQTDTAYWESMREAWRVLTDGVKAEQKRRGVR